MFKIQINAEGLRQTLYQMLDEVIDAALIEMNGQNPENITSDDEFKALFEKIFAQIGAEKLPKGFFETFQITFNYKIDLAHHQVSILPELVNRNETTK